MVRVDSLAFGPFTRTGLSVPVLPRQFLAADGFLGLDVINGSRVTFDFANRILQIEQPKVKLSLLPESKTATHMKLSGTAGRLHVGDCYIDGVRAAAFIDSGAEVSVGNPALSDALTQRHVARREGMADLGQIRLTGVTGGEVMGQLVPIKAIHMEELTFASGALVIADVPNFDSWSLRDKPALLIGMDFLRQFAKVTIDYRSKEVRFDLSQIQEPIRTLARV